MPCARGLGRNEDGLDLALKGWTTNPAERPRLSCMAAMSVGLSISTGQAKDRTALLLLERDRCRATALERRDVGRRAGPRHCWTRWSARQDAAMKVKAEDLADHPPRPAAFSPRRQSGSRAGECSAAWIEAASHAVKTNRRGHARRGADKLPAASVTGRVRGG